MSRAEPLEPAAVVLLGEQQRLRQRIPPRASPRPDGGRRVLVAEGAVRIQPGDLPRQPLWSEGLAVLADVDRLRQLSPDLNSLINNLIDSIH